MKDLTRGSVLKHMVAMATPVAVSMFCNIAYQLIDMHFVAHLGVSAVAGVSAASSAIVLIVALSQMLSAGVLALIAQSLGRGDYMGANFNFNQALVLSGAASAITIVCFVVGARRYLEWISADEQTVSAGVQFAAWVLPGFAALLPMAVLTSALRAAGLVWPAIGFHMLAATLNASLAPVFIAGWGTGVALEVPGAGIATSVSILSAAFLMAMYVHRSQDWLRMRGKLMWPWREPCRRTLAVGLPAGAEAALIFVLPVVILHSIRDFGAAAQAGYSIGLRIAHTVVLPAVSILFSVAPIVGQSFGAANGERVIEVLRKAMVVGAGAMFVTTLLVHVSASGLVSWFDASVASSEVAVEFLRVTSLAFIAQALIYTASSTLQGLGNTLPALISSAAYFVMITASVAWASRQSTFRIEHVWYLMVSALVLQALFSLCLLRAELRRVLPAATNGKPQGRVGLGAAPD